MSTVLHSSAPTISETLAPTPYPDLPASLDTDALLNDFLNWQSSLFALATAHKITIDQLIAWWRSDQTQSKVKAIQEMADARKTILAQLHAAAAVDRLAELVENTREVSPLERRRAAALILKHATPRPAPRSNPTESDRSRTHPPDSSSHVPPQRRRDIRRPAPDNLSQTLSGLPSSHQRDRPRGDSGGSTHPGTAHDEHRHPSPQERGDSLQSS